TCAPRPYPAGPAMNTARPSGNGSSGGTQVFFYKGLLENPRLWEGWPMDRRFAARRDELLADAEVDPQILRGILPRLERFLDPFVASLQRSEQGLHARHYVAGLVSDLKDKDVESIAYLHDQPREPLQQFIGQSPWEHRPLITGLVRQVARQHGS